jgi:hypothetical protein
MGLRMSTALQDATTVQRHRSEQKALEQIAERLATRFPELAADTIVHAIQGRYAEFEGSRIRDFVPVLVERSVRADLTGAR